MMTPFRFSAVLLAGTMFSTLPRLALAVSDDLQLRIAPVPAAVTETNVQSAGAQVPGGANTDFLLGWNSVEEEPEYQQCVSYSAALPTDVDSPSQDGKLDVDQGHSIEDFFDKQTFSLSAAASMGLGAYKGSATFDLLKAHTLNRYSEYLRVTAFAKNNKILMLDSKKITWSAKGNEAKAKSIDVFRNVCGDSFIIGKVTGGLFSGVYVGESKTEEEQSSMHATLSAAATALQGDGKLSAEVSRQLNEFKQTGRIQFHLLRLGQSEQYPKGSPVDLLLYARDYPTKVRSSDTASVLYYIVARYDHFFPDSPKGDVSSVNLDAEARYYRAVFQRMSDIQYMLNNRSQFGDFSKDRAQREVSDLQSALDKRTTDIVACFATPKQKCSLSALQMPKPVPGRLHATPFDPRTGVEVKVGSSLGEDVWVVDNLGQWCFDAGGVCRMIPPVDSRNLWRFQSRIDPVKSLTVSYVKAMIIPPDSDAYFHVDPGPRAGGNRNDNNDAKTILFQPLYPEDYRLPPGFK